MGRRKIDIKKISNKNYLKATFSKRRNGLFRKAGDLCSLSGAQIAVVTFSPGNRPFIFGHPSAEAVIDRFLGEQSSPTLDDDNDDDDDDDEEVIEEESQEEGGDDMDVIKSKFWWDEGIDEGFEVHELKLYKRGLEALITNVACKADEMKMRNYCVKDYLSGVDYWTPIRRLVIACSTSDHESERT